MSPRSQLGRLIRRNLREEDLGKAGIAISLASLTVLAALVAGLQGQASIEAQRGKREADRIGLEAIGRDTSSVIRIGTAYGVYRRWFEQGERASWAQAQGTIALESANRPQLDALYQAEIDIENWLKTQSPLFASTYNTSKGFEFGAFEADTLVRAQDLAAEQRAVEAEVASTWDGKSSDYVTILTILAVGLFFLGLGSTVGRRARPLLSAAGVLFGAGAAVWAILVWTAPIHRVPQEAIDNVVTSQVTLYGTDDNQGDPKLSDKSRKNYTAAIQQATVAVNLDGSYASGYRARADAETAFADALYFSSGPSDEVTETLKGAVADYRAYTSMHGDDYAAWWNLGWSLYLLGDQPASVDATNQALIHSPAQFALYLNRALAFLAGGDQTQALADVDEAIRRAAQDSTDSSQYYLGQSDFDLGRLAQLHPDQGEFLRTVQTRLRQAGVSLRVFGAVTPAADAPQIAQATVSPVQLKQYQGGTLVAGQPLPAGGSFLSTDAVGVRVDIPDAGALGGRTVSARIWVNGLQAPEYDTDVTVATNALTIDLISPYGRAGFDLTPGLYTLDLYVDGARRYQANWTVQPAPNAPQFIADQGTFIGTIKGVGFTCDAPQTTNDGTTANCSVVDNDKTTYIADVSWDKKDRITYLVLAAQTPTDSTGDITTLSHTFFGYVAKQLYPADLATKATAWINTQGTAVDDLDIGGTTMRVYGNTDHQRTMDIYAPWP